jgi:hypothetical protein
MVSGRRITGGQIMRKNSKKILIVAIVLTFGFFIVQGLQTVMAENPSEPTATKRLGVRSLSPGTTTEVVEVKNGADDSNKFTVPANNVLVISSAKVVPEKPGPGTVSVTLWYVESGNRTNVVEYWVGPNDEPTQLDFPDGLIVASESSLVVKNDIGSNGPVRVDIDGFIQAKK